MEIGQRVRVTAPGAISLGREGVVEHVTLRVRFDDGRFGEYAPEGLEAVE
jgi:hypothetical protein